MTCRGSRVTRVINQTPNRSADSPCSRASLATVSVAWKTCSCLTWAAVRGNGNPLHITPRKCHKNHTNARTQTLVRAHTHARVTRTGASRQFCRYSGSRAADRCELKRTFANVGSPRQKDSSKFGNVQTTSFLLDCIRKLKGRIARKEKKKKKKRKKKKVNRNKLSVHHFVMIKLITTGESEVTAGDM